MEKMSFTKNISLIALTITCVLIFYTSGKSNLPEMLYINALSLIFLSGLFIAQEHKTLPLFGFILLGMGIKNITTHLSMDIKGKEQLIEHISSNWINTSFEGWSIVFIVSLISAIAFTVLYVWKKEGTQN